MAFDFNQLQQQLNQLLYNQRNIIDRWRKFLTDPSGTVDFSYYDENGNLQTVSVPNRQKLVNDFIASANAVMRKTVYVDWHNGDDGNDGSSTAPFKTLQKAINSVPPGGFVEIILKNDYRFDNSEHPVEIAIYNRHVRIVLNGYTIYTDIAPNPSNGSLYIKGFTLWHSALQFYFNNLGSRIVINNINDETPAGYIGFITLREFSHCEFVTYESTLDTAASIILANKTRLAQVFGGNSILIRTTSSNATIKFNGPNAELLTVDTGPCLLGLSRIGSGEFFRDENNNIIQPTDIASRITGITRDSTTGLPLNVVCNYRI